jgi:hypothetical protein
MQRVPTRSGARRPRWPIALAFVAMAGIGFAGVTLFFVSSQIKPLLPGLGGFACFAGAFQSRTVDTADWSKGRQVPTGRTRPDGHPETRTEFPRNDDVPLTSLTLRLDYDARKSHYDWMYTFTLVAEAEGLGMLHARGECPWYDKGYADPSGNVSIPPLTISLLCGIDCDGGAMVLSRATGRQALDLAFWRHGLLMKRGCGGGGRIRIYPAKSDDDDFRLERVADTRCDALKALD